MENFFALNIKIMQGAGIYPPVATNKCKNGLIWMFNCISVFYSMIFFTIAELSSLKESAANTSDLVKNLNMSVSFILTLMKISVWFYNHKELMKIMKTLQTTSTKFTPIGDFNPQLIIRNDKALKDRLTYTFFILAFTVPTSACALTLWELLSSSDGVDDFKLPYHSYVPFDYKSSVFRCSLAVVYQCLALLSCGMITVGFDMLFYSIVCFTSTHLKLLQGAFATIKEKVQSVDVSHKIKDAENDYLQQHRQQQRQQREENELQSNMYSELRECIKHLQLILIICEKLETIFHMLILAQIMVSLVVFCTCLYILSSLPMGSNIFGNEIAYMLAIENQLALYCYAGNKLTTRAAEIPNAIYSSDWVTTTSKSYRMNVQFTMMRMTKPIHLTAGKFIAMTLATFVTIGRGSYSLLAVLKNSNN